VRLRSRDKKDRGRDNWLLIKERDSVAKSGGKVAVERETKSVTSGREMEEIAESKKVWHSSRDKKRQEPAAARKAQKKRPRGSRPSSHRSSRRSSVRRQSATIGFTR
jgi:bifunctional non-homologous end joining protein LigD